MWDYIKAAFNARPLGMFVAPNWVGLAAFGLLGLVNPGLWIIGAAAELSYLFLLANNKRFQRYVAGAGPLRLSDRTRVVGARPPHRLELVAEAGPFPAPRACVECLAASSELPFEEGLKFERERFMELMQTVESKALRHAFFAERVASKVPDLPADTPVTMDDLRAFAATGIRADDPDYHEPLRRDLAVIREAERGRAAPLEVVLLGSVATGKYVDVLLDVVGERLFFPTEFVGRGDMSRGALLLRAARADQELAYVRVASALRSDRIVCR